MEFLPLIFFSLTLFAAFTLASAGVSPFSARKNHRDDQAPVSDSKIAYSPRNSIFIFAPNAAHPSCRLQRRLLKPAFAALISHDVSVIEIYGENRPQRNGGPADRIDASLLRRALDAEEGFQVIIVDQDGKTVLRRQAPVLSADLLHIWQHTPTATTLASPASAATIPPSGKEFCPA